MGPPKPGQLYEPCSMCGGTRRTLHPAIVNPGSRLMEKGSPCPGCDTGFTEVGMSCHQLENLLEDRDRLLLALADAAGAKSDADRVKVLDIALNFRGARVGEIRARLGRPGYVPPVAVRNRETGEGGSGTWPDQSVTG